MHRGTDLHWPEGPTPNHCCLASSCTLQWGAGPHWPEGPDPIRSYPKYRSPNYTERQAGQADQSATAPRTMSSFMHVLAQSPTCACAKFGFAIEYVNPNMGDPSARSRLHLSKRYKKQKKLTFMPTPAGASLSSKSVTPGEKYKKYKKKKRHL